MLSSYEKTESELHLFIIWNNGQKFKEQILDTIRKCLSIRLIKDLRWKEDEFSLNLRRFYGRNLPEKSDKARECGLGLFTVIIVEDNSPIYAPRYTNQGVQVVNVHMFDMKDQFRRLVKSNVIHATNSQKEFEHDVTLLLGMNPTDLIANGFQSDISSDEYYSLCGTTGWKDIKELLYVLNSTTNYVVLRNFENYPDSIQYGAHSDIDLLCENYKTTQLLLNGEPTSTNRNRVQNKIMVGDSYINVDIRYIGDNYLDSKWETDILMRRVLRQNGFYTPCDIDYLYSMTYHALIQKSKISEDYIVRTKELSKKLGIESLDLLNPSKCLSCLEDYMRKYNYEYVEPKDATVAYNFQKVHAKAGFSRRFHYLKHVVGHAIKG